MYSEDMAGLMRLVLGYGYMNKLLQGKGVQLYSALAAPQLALTLWYNSSLSFPVVTCSCSHNPRNMLAR